MNSTTRLAGVIVSFVIAIALAIIALLHFKFGIAFLSLIAGGSIAGIIARTEDENSNDA